MKSIFSKFLIFWVRAYQLILSPMLGPRCRFYPSCSSYMMEAIEVHGPVKGLWLGLKRISRCHPGSEGGIDPVPGTESRYESSVDEETNPEARSTASGDRD